MDGEKKKNILLIYGDPNHQSGWIYKDLLEKHGYKVTLEMTRARFRMDDMLTTLIRRHQPDLIIAGSHLDPHYTRMLEEEKLPLLLLSIRTEKDLAEDRRIGSWRKSPIFKG